MNSKTLICLLVMSVINIATSTSSTIATKGLHNSTENFKGSLEQDIILTTTIDYNTLVATTPKIIARQSKVLNRYVNICYTYEFIYLIKNHAINIISFNIYISNYKSY